MAEEKEILLKIEVDRSQSQKQLEDVNKQLILNKSQLEILNNTFKQGNVSVDDYVKQSIKLKSSQKTLTDQQKILTKELTLESNSLDSLRSKLSSLTKERNSINQGTIEGAKRFKELQAAILETTTAIKQQEEAGGDFRRNVGNYSGSLKEAVGGVQVFGTSLSSLFTTILTNPIGILVAALALLGKALMSNDTIATAFKGVMTGLGIAVDQASAFIAEIAKQFGEFLASGTPASNFVKDFGARLINSAIAPLRLIIDLIPAVSKLFAGDFKGAAIAGADAALNFGKNLAFMNDEMIQVPDNIKKAIKAGLEYEAALDDIEAKQSKLNVTVAELENQRDRLFLQAKDISKSEEERIALLEKGEEINKQILKSRLELIGAEIKAQKTYIETLGEDQSKREEAQFRLNDLEVKRLNAINESLRFEELAINKKNALIEKERDANEKLEAERIKNAEEERKRQEKAEKDLIEYYKRVDQADFELRQSRLQRTIKTLEKESEISKEAIDERVRLEIELERERIQNSVLNKDLELSEIKRIQEEYKQRELELYAQGEAQKQALDKKTTDFQKQQFNQRVSLAGDLFGALSQLAEDGSEDQKALASVASLINTFQGVTGALANSAPPPVGIGPVAAGISAATILTTGLAQVAKINAAAGGGDFVTTKPTLLLVGDNPGGKERVTVEPLSGKGQTKIHPNSGMIAMAGGGTLTTGAAISRLSSSSISNDIQSSSIITNAIQSMPAPQVSVKEVTKVSNRVKTKEAIRKL